MPGPRLVPFKKSIFYCFVPGCAHESSSFQSGSIVREHLVSSHNFEIPEDFRAKGRRKYPKMVDPYRQRSAAEPFACPFCSADRDCMLKLRIHVQHWHAELLPATLTIVTEEEETDLGRLSHRKEYLMHAQYTGIPSIPVPIAPMTMTTALNDDASPPPCTTPERRSMDDVATVTDPNASDKADSSSLSLEHHLASMLLERHVQLLVPNSYPADLASMISPRETDAVVRLVREKFELVRPPMPMVVMIAQITVADALVRGEMSRDEALVRLFTISNLTRHQRRVTKMLASLISSLPDSPRKEGAAYDASTCKGLVNKFLTGLFEDPERDVAVWTENPEPISHDAQDPKALPSHTASVLTLSRFCGANREANHGHALIRPPGPHNDALTINSDLFRITMDCKATMDKHKMTATLGIQAIGYSVAFYLLVQPVNETYTMFKLTEIDVPRCMTDLHGLIVKLPEMIMVLEAFDAQCLGQKVESPLMHTADPSTTPAT
ncbi:hypothetical protein BC940DRAFT_299069 [Gongronella butleri]|nr:hypothetical protein BC940DRAFT_299069 [Gongronella butleri]